MKVMFIITGSDKYTWMSEVTHPYWHLIERGVEVDFFTPNGGPVLCDPASNPFDKHSKEPEDLVSKGFLSDAALVEALNTTKPIKDADLASYAGVHVAGGTGAVYDLFPNEDVGAALEHFWRQNKVVGAICHGVIALANNPDRVRGLHATGYTIEEDRQDEAIYGVKNPQLPQTAIEQAGVHFRAAPPHGTCVVVDGKLVTGQNQFSASEYGLALYHALTGQNPVTIISR